MQGSGALPAGWQVRSVVLPPSSPFSHVRTLPYLSLLGACEPVHGRRTTVQQFVLVLVRVPHPDVQWVVTAASSQQPAASSQQPSQPLPPAALVQQAFPPRRPSAPLPFPTSMPAAFPSSQRPIYSSRHANRPDGTVPQRVQVPAGGWDRYSQVLFPPAWLVPALGMIQYCAIATTISIYTVSLVLSLLLSLCVCRCQCLSLLSRRNHHLQTIPHY